MDIKSKNEKIANLPSKKTMNFIPQESGINLKKFLCLILGILVLGAPFAKFAILDPLAQKAMAEKALAEKEAQLAAIHVRLEGYEALEKEYGRYSYGWMNDTEVNTVNPMDVLCLIEEEIAPVAFIDDLAINNNILTMNIHGITLEQAGTMVKRLEAHDLVRSAAVYNAVAQNAGNAEILLRIVLGKEAAQ